MRIVLILFLALMALPARADLLIRNVEGAASSFTLDWKQTATICMPAERDHVWITRSNELQHLAVTITSTVDPDLSQFGKYQCFLITPARMGSQAIAFEYMSREVFRSLPPGSTDVSRADRHSAIVVTVMHHEPGQVLVSMIKGTEQPEALLIELVTNLIGVPPSKIVRVYPGMYRISVSAEPDLSDLVADGLVKTGKIKFTDHVWVN